MSTAAPDVITSVTNARVKHLVALRRRRTRDAEDVCLIEGYDELSHAVAAGVVPQEVYLCPALIEDDPLDLAARLAAIAPVFHLSQPAFEKAAYRTGPDGWLALAPGVESALEDLELGPNPLVIVCGSVEKPGNLGSILRTADAAGATAVVSVDPVTDWGNPNIIRASKGALFSVPVASASTAEFLAWARSNELSVVATTPAATDYVTDLDLSGPTAILVGAEHEGLSAELLDGADRTAKLPMYGRVDSLNVGVSAAITVYEAVRQRRITTERS
ncbi:TrmH family RNA methyltransferase [Kribbella sp. NPDC058245]|uniref:TrmH family RNA methyltransferase n=1 Tax=Kribbella sp. NPDC058245 TaxID=3346399 RepID=UPI0036EF0892